MIDMIDDFDKKAIKFNEYLNHQLKEKNFSKADGVESEK